MKECPIKDNGIGGKVPIFNLFDKLPSWLANSLARFAIEPIDFADVRQREAAITQMDQVFGFDDPFLDYLIRPGTDEARAKARRLVYQMDINGFVAPYGTAWKADEGRAAAWWTPPWAAKLNFWQTIALVPIGMRVIGWSRTIEGFSILGAVEKARPARPHWYLNNLGVDSDQQKRRLGTALMLPVLWHADQGEHPCFLMFARPANEAYYNRFGFKLSEKQPLLPSTAPFYRAMIREPGDCPITQEKARVLLSLP